MNFSIEEELSVSTVKDSYSDTGHPSIGPELLLRIEFRRISLFFRQVFVTSWSRIANLAGSGWLKRGDSDVSTSDSDAKNIRRQT